MIHISSTNRGAIRKPQDFYVTPDYSIQSFLDNYIIQGKEILEPSAGNGAIVRTIHKRFGNMYNTTSIEIRPEEEQNLKPYGKVIIADFLTWKPDKHYDTIFTNPPFSLTQEFIEKSLTIADEVIMLQRVNFLGAQKRLEFWQKHPVNYLYILSKRPSFIGGNDSSEYAWFVWKKDVNEQRIVVI